MPTTAYRFLDSSAIHLVEQNAATLLREQGILLKGDPQSLDTLASIGGIIEGERVYLNADLLREIITSTAPPQFMHPARNPIRSTLIGGGDSVCCPVYGAPQFYSPNRSRRFGTLVDYQALVAMAQASPAITNTGHMICVPNDAPEDSVKRSLHMAHAHLHFADKPFIGSILSPQALSSVVELTHSAFATPQTDGVRLLHLINSIPPLTYPANALACLRKAVQLRQGVMIASFMQMGAMAPCTVMGALAQGLAEVMVGAALAQLYAPGSAMVLGIYGLPFSMRRMLPEFGDPISWQMQLSAGSVLRRLNVPVLAYAGLTSSNTDDAQAGYQAGFHTLSAFYSGADFLLHSVGWLENGRQVSMVKFQREAHSLMLLNKVTANQDLSVLEMEQETKIRYQSTLNRLLSEC
jgi:trimethylamine--corrinoid protein Co-methyltransferase